MSWKLPSYFLRRSRCSTLSARTDKRVRAARREGRLHGGEGAGHHFGQLARITHLEHDFLLTRLEQRLQLAQGGVLAAVAVALGAHVLEAVARRIPIAHHHFEAVDLLDVVLIGDLDHVAQHAVVERHAVDGQLEARHPEAAGAADGFLGEIGERWSQPLPCSMRRDAQDAARLQPARILDAVVVGDAAPFAGALVVAAGDRRQRLADRQHMAVTAVRRVQIELVQLLFRGAVLAQHQGHGGAQRHAFRAEHGELLAHAFGHSGKAVAALIAPGLVQARSPGNLSFQ